MLCTAPPPDRRSGSGHARGRRVVGDDLVRAYIDSGAATIGTPDDAIAAIEKSLADTGGFGVAMLMAHDWANSRATAESYELIARYVVPHFQQMNGNRELSIEDIIARRAQEKDGTHGFDRARAG